MASVDGQLHICGCGSINKTFDCLLLIKNQKDRFKEGTRTRVPRAGVLQQIKERQRWIANKRVERESSTEPHSCSQSPLPGLTTTEPPRDRCQHKGSFPRTLMSSHNSWISISPHLSSCFPSISHNSSFALLIIHPPLFDSIGLKP